MLFDGQDVAWSTVTSCTALRRAMQIIFQDPYGSLNPRMTVAELIAEPMVIHREGDASTRTRRVQELLSSSASQATLPRAIRMNSPAVSDSASELRVRWP